MAPVAEAPDDPGDDVVIIVKPRPRLPAAAAVNVQSRLGLAGSASDAGRGSIPTLYLLTLISAADGSLLLLAAAGHFETIGGSLIVGLLVVAGAGSWLAAHQAFGGRGKTSRDWAVLVLLGLLTFAATVASAWLGLTLGQGLTLHVLPKAIGIVLFLVAGEVAGFRLRVGPVPAPLAAIAAAGVLEAALRWTP
jgi:hypothetical protein